ncbi:MAG: exodeoxyribonuclease I [Gammaproteobacteria bacterium]|nr:exodeoxyribonuclease I [Gammaproteobacteria bacterium]
MARKTTLYWHDYETFGINPKCDRIAQFAGLRTDEDLNIIGDPLVIYCRAADDMLPQPEACLVTGITPQKTLEDGLIEAEFIAAIHEEFASPGTCVVGFNNIRFDDEFTRYTLYRNFFDPYAREWQNGCSRWDIIDMVRVTRALRPEGIEWPVDENGIATNRLELITAANGISHTAAHDALSDVHATIAVARLIKQKQPKLYNYIFESRNKRKVAEMLKLAPRTPVLHTSGMYPGDVCNTAMIAPMIQHPTNNNGIVVYDLRYDPTQLIELDADSIKQYLYTPRDELPEGMERIALKTIHINKCPVVTPLNTLDEAAAQRTNIDKQQHLLHLEMLNRATGLDEKIRQVFSESTFEASDDPDQGLYSGGFFSNEDRQRMERIRQTPASELAELRMNFDDARIPEMLFRYRARNYPETLTADEQQQWLKYKTKRLKGDISGSSITLHDYFEKLDAFLEDEQYTTEQVNMLKALKDYGEIIRQQIES